MVLSQMQSMMSTLIMYIVYLPLTSRRNKTFQIFSQIDCAEKYDGQVQVVDF